MTDRPQRLHGLDAIRGYALMLGVVFHATMSFLPGPQIWLVADTERSAVLSAIFFVTHMFRMTTFFLIAGFFAHLSFHKRGLKGFALERLKRIALPLVVGWPMLIAAIALSAGYAAYVATGTFPTKPPPTPPGPPLSFPLTHLWFLYVLLLLYAVTLLLRSAVARLDHRGGLRGRLDGVVAAIVRSPAAPLVLGIPVATAFGATPGWLAWFGVPTPDMNLVPNLPAAVQFGLAFGLGWLLHRQAGLLNALTRNWAQSLALAAVLTGALLAGLGAAPVTTPDAPGLLKIAHAAAYGVATWSWTFAVIGLALRFLADESPVRRYIADSSYWIYLIHLPLVVVLQAMVSRLAWPWELKFAVVLGVGFGLMFASYELLVRHTFVGAVLNGRRVPWRRGHAPIPQPEAAR
jgi:hypothetical protein